MKHKVIDFIKDYNHISPLDLEEILETLEDCGYLNKEGKEFRTELWKLFVKDNPIKGSD